jgi:hypothetical protein
MRPLFKIPGRIKQGLLLILIYGGVMLGLIFWGYFALVPLYSFYIEANNPTPEQIESSRLRVNVNELKQTLSDIEDRRLY